MGRRREGRSLGAYYIKRGIIILTGLVLVLGGSGLLFRDFYGESIDNAARAVAVNVVAMKINQSLKEGMTIKKGRG